MGVTTHAFLLVKIAIRSTTGKFFLKVFDSLYLYQMEREVMIDGINVAKICSTRVENDLNILNSYVVE